MSTTISGTSGVTFPDSTSMQTGQQACKAWVNFNGTGTVAIRGGYNVSSITDNGTGDYTVNFTNAMVNANYTIIITCGGVSGNTTTAGTLGNPTNSSSASVVIGSSSRDVKVDRAVNSVAIFSN